MISQSVTEAFLWVVAGLCVGGQLAIVAWHILRSMGGEYAW